MVKPHNHTQDASVWLRHVAETRSNREAEKLHHGIVIYAEFPQELLQKAIQIADILLALDLDSNTVLAGLLYPALKENIITIDGATEKFGDEVSHLLHDALQMQTFDTISDSQKKNINQTENMRKLLLAIVSDVQAILIILSEKIYDLRSAKERDEPYRKALAKNTLDIYAPLANRLGVWQIKWEIEDLCLRYNDPAAYSMIAKSLAARRDERESYKNRVIDTLKNQLNDAKIINFDVTGRVKHIYSIYSKMQRKDADFTEIYDISAFRILVDTIPDCYAVLGLLQNSYIQIPEEFDDYISQPKPNGYRSLHAVMVGPEENVIEVQIRTREMHNQAELGVASHWRYKEGVLDTSHYEAKIALLRQVMEWQSEVSTTSTKEIFGDRVYVFTPMGDIIDLPQNSTPLDFAYQVHSEIGHRCRGAKVNNKMVQLTYHLKTGDRVEVITAKEANPSRDWLNPHSGYLNSPRARAKLAHWFRVKDNALNKAVDESEEVKHHAKPKATLPIKKRDEITSPSLTFDDLLSRLATCCKPLPGDPVIGYITMQHGISIHRENCPNISHMKQHHAERFININLGEKFTGSYPVDIHIIANDRKGLLRDITEILAAENVSLMGVSSHVTPNKTEVLIQLTIIITNIDELNRTIGLIRNISNILDVRRH